MTPYSESSIPLLLYVPLNPPTSCSLPSPTLPPSLPLPHLHPSITAHPFHTLPAYSSLLYPLSRCSPLPPQVCEPSRVPELLGPWLLWSPQPRQAGAAGHWVLRECDWWLFKAWPVAQEVQTLSLSHAAIHTLPSWAKASQMAEKTDQGPAGRALKERHGGSRA